MTTTNTYRGKVLQLKQVGLTAFGIRTFKVTFGAGVAYIDITSKQTLGFNVGDTIEFSGHWAGQAYFIDDLWDVRPMGLTQDQICMLYERESRRRNRVMTK